MSELANTQRNRQIVIDAICDVFEISEDYLCSRRRVREVTQARQMYFKIAREYLGMTLKSIGASLRADRKGYDHTTVMYSIKLVDGLMDIQDAETLHQYEQVINRIKQRAKLATTIEVNVGIDQVERLMSFLQREDISFKVVESLILPETKNETDGTK